MKSSQKAKEIITERLVDRVAAGCEYMLSRVIGISVSRELNLSDSEIIREVVMEEVKPTLSLDLWRQPNLRRAMGNRAEGLFRQWLKNKGGI